MVFQTHWYYTAINTATAKQSKSKLYCMQNVLAHLGVMITGHT